MSYVLRAYVSSGKKRPPLCTPRFGRRLFDAPYSPVRAHFIHMFRCGLTLAAHISRSIPKEWKQRHNDGSRHMGKPSTFLCVYFFRFLLYIEFSSGGGGGCVCVSLLCVPHLHFTTNTLHKLNVCKSTNQHFQAVRSRASASAQASTLIYSVRSVSHT